MALSQGLGEENSMRPIEILELGRGPTLAGSRITVYDIIPYLETGRSVNTIALALSLSMREVEALIQYINEHRDAVMAVHRRIEERITRGNPPEIEAKLRESHVQLLALREELRQQRARQEADGERNSD
jgi:uncharacterized protein (DUF433 family)